MTGPIRTCSGCKAKLPQAELIRIRLDGEEWRVNQNCGGRSVYWCGQEKCLKALLSKGRVAWGLKRPITQDLLSELCPKLAPFTRYN